MNDLTNNPPENVNPLAERLTDEYADAIARRDDLLAGIDRATAIGAIADEETAGKFTDFIKQIGAAVKNAEAARVSEKEPYLENGRTVDGWFKRITEPHNKGKESLTSMLTSYERAKAEAERKARVEAEQLAREAEAEAARIAAEAEAAAEDDAGMDSAIDAAQAAAHAAADAEQARKDAAAKAADLSRTRGDLGAVSSLVTFWDFSDLDRAALDLEAIRAHIPQDAIEKAVRSFIKAGGRELEGVKIFENTRARVA